MIGVFTGKYYGIKKVNLFYSVNALVAHGVAIAVWFIISKVNLSNSCLHKVDDPEDRPEIWAEGAPIFSLILGVGMLLMTLLFVFAHWTKSDEIIEIMHEESGSSLEGS